MRISDWSSDVCSSDLAGAGAAGGARASRFAGLSVAGRAYGVHDAVAGCGWGRWRRRWQCRCLVARGAFAPSPAKAGGGAEHDERHYLRSEEHTSELQSLMRISYAVFCLKKKKNRQITNEALNS